MQNCQYISLKANVNSFSIRNLLIFRCLAMLNNVNNNFAKFLIDRLFGFAINFFGKMV